MSDEKQVHDKGLTLSINLNNVMTALMLTAIVFGGRTAINSFRDMSDSLRKIQETQALLVWRVDRLEAKEQFNKRK